MSKDELVDARYIGTTEVQTTAGQVLNTGSIIKMRRAEAEGRADFEVVTAKKEEVKKGDS